MKKLMGKQQMQPHNANYNVVVRFHQVVIGLALLAYIFFNEARKNSVIVLSAAVVSLLIQLFLYRLKMEWYGDKNVKHPYED